MPRLNNDHGIMPGDEFGGGVITVLKRLPDKTKPSGWTVDMWLVQCSCGAKFKVQGDSLVSGRVTMCKFCSGEWTR